MRRRPKALLALLAASATALALVAVVTGRTAPAQALSGSQFDAGNIISDGVFYDSQTMTAADVQAFLDQQYTGCASGYVCLKDYTTKTTSEPAESGLCAAYTGQASETAAQIIANVAVACGVNPQSLLVLLQKESSLVTTSTPNYQTATGFGCPDSTGCNSKYYGFFNQVYLAARQFKLYRLYPTNYNYVAGRSNYILYNPNTKCGGSNVVIQNQATAGLYDYTPYQPNAAALANMPGTGDKCSAYGNRNFWYYFNTWFPNAGGPQVSGGLLVTQSDGSLSYYRNTGVTSEPYQYPPVQVGAHGWLALTHLATGDINGDGIADVVATRSDGTLWLYPATGNGLPFTKRLEIGAGGWGAFSTLVLGDVNGDGKADLVAVKPDGTMMLYLNNGNATHPFHTSTQIGTGWNGYQRVLLGDVDGDGFADIVAVKNDGSLWLFHNSGDATAPFSAGVQIGASGWSAFHQMVLTDVNADGLADVVASRPNGTLWLYLNAPGQARPFGHPTEIGLSGWQAFPQMLATDVPVPHAAATASSLVATQSAGTLWRFANQQQRPYGSYVPVGSGWQHFTRLLLADLDGDGRADLVGVKPDGSLWLYPNSGSATHPYAAATARKIGTGWQHFTQLLAGDVNGDGRAELLGVLPDGTLWLYRNTGNAAHPVGSRTEIGSSGWGQYDRIVAADVNGDGKADLIATRPDGSLVRYLSNGNLSHPYGAPQSTALTGWQDYAALAAGDLDGDGRAELVASKPAGSLWMDRDAGSDRFPRTVSIGASGWQHFDTILAGDVTGNGLADVLARTPAGAMRLYANTGDLAKVFAAAQQVGASGWQRLAPLTMGDVNGDGRADLIGVRSNGSLWLYPATDPGAPKPFDASARTQIGASGWTGFDALVAGDVDGDGYADLIGRKPDGTLWLYRNVHNLSAPYSGTPTQIGTGWQQYDTILAADVNGDGLVDLIARKPDGTLWLYANSHDPLTPFPSAVEIGTGWQQYDKIAAGDVDGDGRADLVASKPDGSLWLYRNSGVPGAPFPAPLQLSATGAAGYDRLLL